MVKFSLIFVLIQFFILTFCYGQKGILINPADSNVYQVIMGNGSYKFPNRKIYLYNLWDRNRIITVSILPNIEDGKTNWDTIGSVPLNVKLINLYDDAFDAINMYENSNKSIIEKISRLKTTEFQPYFLRDHYIVSTKNTCLVEYYELVNNLAVNDLDQFNFITIFPNAPQISKNKLDSFVNYSSNHLGIVVNTSGKLLLGKKSQLNKEPVYCFWLTSPPMLHAGWYYYGIEKFIFIPDIGIIGGTYYNYFRGNTGGVVSRKVSKFENNTRMFKPITINGKFSKNSIIRMNQNQ